MSIVLVGFMGAGKTTIGHLLSESLQIPHIDIDEYIEKQIGMTISEYFELHGEKAFRKKETQALKELVMFNGILSTGGGIILNETNRNILKDLPNVFFLESSLEELVVRVNNDSENERPLVKNKTIEDIREIFEPRVSLYKEVATHTIDTTKKAPEVISTEIIKLVGE